MTKKQKKLIQALKDLNLTKDVTKAEIVKRSDELTKNNFVYGYCENYTFIKEVYKKRRFLLNNYKKLKDLEDFNILKML